MKIYVVVMALVFLTGCVGTGSFTSYNASKNVLTLQSSDDPRTAMPKMRSLARVKGVKKELRTELVLNKRNVDAMLNLSQIFLAEGDLTKAEKIVRRALRIDLKNKLAKKILCEIYLRRGNTQMATIIINGLGGDKSRDSEILNMMGLIALSENRKADVMYLFKKGLSLNPNDVAIRMNMGVLHTKYRQLNQAAIQFERVLKIIPEHNDAILHLAIIKSSRGDAIKSEDLYNKILSRKGNNPIALYNFAVLKMKKQQYDEAKTLLKKYLSGKFAKRSSNDEIYALLEEIGVRSRSDKGGISDDEIHKMAEDVEDSGVVAKQLPNESETSEIDEDIRALEGQLE